MTGAARPGGTTVATPTDRDVVITRVVNAPRAIVFKAFTEPRLLQQWLTGPEGWTMPICELDLRPGGSWRYVYRQADGAEMTLSGLVHEVRPPERLVTSESWGPEWPDTVNTMVLAESKGQTTITITVTYPSKDARDAALKTGMTEGMEQSYVKLDTLVRTLA